MSRPDDGYHVTHIARREDPGGRVRVWACEPPAPDLMFRFTGPWPVVAPDRVMTRDESNAWVSGLEAEGFKCRVMMPAEVTPSAEFRGDDTLLAPQLAPMTDAAAKPAPKKPRGRK